MEDEIIVNKGFLDDLGLVDVVALPIYIILIVFFTSLYRKKQVQFFSYYKFFSKAIYTKLFGTVVFCSVFTYYYKGGDTIAYFESCRAFSNLLWQRPSDFITVFFSEGNYESYNIFSAKTGYPWNYLFGEPRTLFLIKLMSPVVFIGFNSYLISSILISFITFFGLWKAYKLIVSYYPLYEGEIALGIFFVPTVVFWGSGMLKDTITLSAFCWFIVGFEGLLISKKRFLYNFFILSLSAILIVSIKPYILMAATPGILTWLLYSPVSKIKNKLLKYLTLPLVLLVSISLGFFLLSSLGDSLGKFSLDKVMETAAVTQDDLKRDYYKGSSFDIGKFEATPAGMLSKAPEAIIAGLFRPFIWEARNFTTLMSGIENLLILILVVLVLIRMKIIGIFKYLFDHPILLFFFLYSLLFAFSIGISTSNFGALIRFKIAFAPFFIALFLLLYRLSSKKNQKTI